MPENNFKLFDENKDNMMTDAEYVINAQRLSGVQSGVASSQLNNKFAYQVSLIAFAIAQMMNANGIDATDTMAVSQFVNNLSSTVLQKVVDKATTAQAVAGTDDTKWMSPAKVSDAVNKNVNSLLTGQIAFFAMQNPPEGWLYCDGRAISRTQYAALFSKIGTTYGTGNGSTTFNIPDLRGEFIRGWNGSDSGIDPSRQFGSKQEGTMYKYSTLGNANVPTYFKNYENTDDTVGGTVGSTNGYGYDGYFRRIRPNNIALLPCIKY